MALPSALASAGASFRLEAIHIKSMPRAAKGAVSGFSSRAGAATPSSETPTTRPICPGSMSCAITMVQVSSE